MAIDVIAEELDFFKAAASRMRWLINTAVLISILILLHIYLANFSIQNFQLKGLVYNRFNYQIIDLRECQGFIFNTLVKHADDAPETREKLKNDVIADNPNCAALSNERRSHLLKTDLETLIRNYSAFEYAIQTNENTMNGERLPLRSIPFLDMSVPANDFVIVMAMMSMFIIVGVWMNLRGIYAALVFLQAHGDISILRVAQLNTVFLTYSEIGENKLAKRIRSLSMWLPFFSIATATLIGYLPIFSIRFFGNQYNLTDTYNGTDFAIFIFLCLYLLVSTVHYWMALKCNRTMKEIDRIFQETLASNS